METLIGLLVIAAAVFIVPLMLWGIFLGPLFIIAKITEKVQGKPSTADKSSDDKIIWVWILGSLLLFFAIGCWVTKHGNRPNYHYDPLADPDLYPDGPSQLPHHLR